MAHPRRRSVDASNRLAGRAARAQTPRGLHRVAPYRREHPAQRRVRLLGQYGLHWCPREDQSIG